MTILKGGTNICGATIGVLCLDSKFPKPPGHIKNPSGLDFPVIYETVTGATVPKLLANPGPEFIKPFIKAAQKLEAEGVRAITGSCGFLALYQRELADSVNVPVFASSLIQVPMVANMLGGPSRVGIVTASANSLTDRHFAAVGASNIPKVVTGLDESTEFREVVLEGLRNDLDIAKVEREFLESVTSLINENRDIGALVLECTDLPPYAHRVQEEFALPIFDLTTLATMVHNAVARVPYSGIMP